MLWRHGTWVLGAMMYEHMFMYISQVELLRSHNVVAVECTLSTLKNVL